MRYHVFLVVSILHLFLRFRNFSDLYIVCHFFSSFSIYIYTVFRVNQSIYNRNSKTGVVCIKHKTFCNKNSDESNTVHLSNHFFLNTIHFDVNSLLINPVLSNSRIMFYDPVIINQCVLPFPARTPINQEA